MHFYKTNSKDIFMQMNASYCPHSYTHSLSLSLLNPRHPPPHLFIAPEALQIHNLIVTMISISCQFLLIQLAIQILQAFGPRRLKCIPPGSVPHQPLQTSLAVVVGRLTCWTETMVTIFQISIPAGKAIAIMYLACIVTMNWDADICRTILACMTLAMKQL
jgi:hypothetical protein